MNGIADYVVDRIRRPYPAGGHVVPQSTPVIAFGDHTTARVASVGINPSSREFQDNSGKLLKPGSKRLADLEMLGARSPADLTDDDVEAVVQWCAGYFSREPYKTWFDKLNVCVGGTGADFYDGTACHLDLVQWATDPVWGNFPPGDASVQDQLLRDDAEFLRHQLSSPNFEVILLNPDPPIGGRDPR